MPHLLSLRRAAVVASSAALLATVPASALGEDGSGSAEIACADDQVTIVVDFNELGGRTRVACAGGGTAARLFDRAGFPLTTANTPGMQGFVCTVSGRPRKGTCGRESAYWSLWWSAAGESDWAYASLGVNDLTLEPGDHLGFAWHQGKGSAAPPDVVLADGGGVDADAGEQVARGAGEPVASDRDDSAGAATWLLVGGAVVVLGAAAAVPLRRRRRRS